jgi:radical SAM superfamily enzyme YgiQ (UPF0313 family)
MAEQKPGWAGLVKQVGSFVPSANPTFHNPTFDTAPYRVLIVRLSPFRDVDRSIPHLFLFQEVRRALPDGYIDIAFFPSTEERALFEEHGIPYLIGIHSLRPVQAFDLVLISNAYTLELINLPYLLIRSGIPLFSSQRGREWPLFLLGGSNGMAAQSIIREDGDSMVDGVFFGEGEGLVSELVGAISKATSQPIDKRELLVQVAERVPGLWASGSDRKITKAVCAPEARFLPVAYPVLNSPEVHTANLQINYGCPAFCSFCFEGYDRKPYREIPLSEILSAARRIKQAQGVEELNLYSFNANTHWDILEMLLALNRLFDRVSLKSQRVDVLHSTPGLLEAEVAGDKRDFTLGIEGVSERLRAWLHKSLSTRDITALLDRILALKVRRIKLFYILTGHETAADMEEFRRFVRWLKTARRSKGPRLRVVFSFGLLIRMPFTPLRYDRLFLDPQEVHPLIGQVKSACETNGFEFRLAFDWPVYCTAQVLAMGGHWLAEPMAALAEQGYFFDTTLPPGYWDELKGWMAREGHWQDAFLGEKGPDYAFALDFVKSNVSDEFLYRQYREAQAGADGGYCLGSDEQAGRCLGCGACVNEEQRQAVTHHRIRQPEHKPGSPPFRVELREVMANKRRLEPVYYLVRLAPWLAGTRPEFINALVLKGLLGCCPDLVDNLLSVRESLFTQRPMDRRFPAVSGETVCGLRAWDVEALELALRAGAREGTGDSGFEIVGPIEGFAPGAFTKLHLDVHLPAQFFPEPRARLESYLRSVYVPYSLRREGERLRFELARKALKKKILLGGFMEPYAEGDDGEEGLFASLDVGSKFDLGALLGTFDGKRLALQARVHVSQIEWS